MPWLLVDVLLPLAVLVLLGATVVRLWRRVKALGKAVGEASSAVSDATRALEQVQSPRA